MPNFSEFKDLENRIKQIRPSTAYPSPQFKRSLHNNLMEQTHMNPKTTFNFRGALAGVILLLVIPFFFWLTLQAGNKSSETSANGLPAAPTRTGILGTEEPTTTMTPSPVDTPTVTPTPASETNNTPATTGWHLDSADFNGEPLTIDGSRTWSPDGRKVVYRIPSSIVFDRTDSSNDIDDWLEYGSIDDIWTAELDANGRLQPPVFIGQVERPGWGCGGGGDSWADRLYNIQSNSFETFHMYWTTDDILLYPLECSLHQIYGRFDINTGEMLPPIEGKLTNLAISNEKDRWFAITAPLYNDEGRPMPETRRIVTGVPAETTYVEIPTSTAVEILYVGPEDGRLYYTSRESIQTEDLSAQVGWPLGSQFHFFHTQLYSINPDGTDEILHWEGDDHSYSGITTDENGDLLFYLIENDTELLEAVQNGVPEAEWPKYAPKAYLMRQPEPLTEPIIVREDFAASTILESHLP